MSRLQNKMQNYEVPPPADAWENIVASLDESASGTAFPSRLYNMEVPPPPGLWQAIDSSLHPSSEAVVVAMKKRTSFFRYAAAAVVIGIIATGLLLWTTANTNTQNGNIASAPPATTTETPGNENSTLQKTTGEASDVIVSAKDNDLPARPETTKNAQRSRTTSSAGYRYAAAGQNEPIYAYEDHIPRLADRYIMLMTPDGNVIRMSKKWENLVCCVSGEEQDADCKSQLKKWQEKMASSPLAPSPGNFMDILSMVSSLDDSPEL